MHPWDAPTGTCSLRRPAHWGLAGVFASMQCQRAPSPECGLRCRRCAMLSTSYHCLCGGGLVLLSPLPADSAWLGGDFGLSCAIDVPATAFPCKEAQKWTMPTLIRMSFLSMMHFVLSLACLICAHGMDMMRRQGRRHELTKLWMLLAGSPEVLPFVMHESVMQHNDQGKDAGAVLELPVARFVAPPAVTAPCSEGVVLICSIVVQLVLNGLPDADIGKATFSLGVDLMSCNICSCKLHLQSARQSAPAEGTLHSRQAACVQQQQR